MKFSRPVLFLAALVSVGLSFVPRPALGHHSATMFDNTRVQEISGTVKDFQWKNPHVWIQVEVVNGEGVKQEWSIEGGGPNTLSRQGWRPTTFKAGETVTVRINPMRDGTPGGLFVGAKFADSKTIGKWD